MNPWFLQDLPNPDYWLRMTSPNDSTCPSTPTGITSSPPVPFKTPATSFSDTTSLTDSTASVTHPDAIFPGPSNYPTPPSSSARANSTSGISGTSASGFIVQHTAADEEDPITQFAPIEKIEVTDKERDAAMSAVKFRWRRQGASGEKKKESRGSRVMVGGVSKVTEEVSELQVQKGGLLRVSFLLRFRCKRWIAYYFLAFHLITVRHINYLNRWFLQLVNLHLACLRIRCAPGIRIPCIPRCTRSRTEFPTSYVALSHLAPGLHFKTLILHPIMTVLPVSTALRANVVLALAEGATTKARILVIADLLLASRICA